MSGGYFKGEARSYCRSKKSLFFLYIRLIILLFASMTLKNECKFVIANLYLFFFIGVFNEIIKHPLQKKRDFLCRPFDKGFYSRSAAVRQ